MAKQKVQVGQSLYHQRFITDQGNKEKSFFILRNSPISIQSKIILEKFSEKDPSLKKKELLIEEEALPLVVKQENRNFPTNYREMAAKLAQLVAQDNPDRDYYKIYICERSLQAYGYNEEDLALGEVRGLISILEDENCAINTVSTPCVYHHRFNFLSGRKNRRAVEFLDSLISTIPYHKKMNHYANPLSFYLETDCLLDFLDYNLEYAEENNYSEDKIYGLKALLDYFLSAYGLEIRCLTESQRKSFLHKALVPWQMLVEEEEGSFYAIKPVLLETQAEKSRKLKSLCQKISTLLDAKEDELLGEEWKEDYQAFKALKGKKENKENKFSEKDFTQEKYAFTTYLLEKEKLLPDEVRAFLFLMCFDYQCLWFKAELRERGIAVLDSHAPLTPIQNADEENIAVEDIRFFN